MEPNFGNFHFKRLEILLVVIAAIMLILISYGYFFLVWLTMAPMFYIAFLRNHKETIVYSIMYGIITYVFFFNWINRSELGYIDIIFLAFVFTLHFVLVMTIVSIFSKKIQNNFMALLPPVAWLISLWLYSLLPLQIYWMDFAIFYPSMAPWIWYLGSHGITFIIILFNSAIAYYFIKPNKYAVAFGVVILFMIFTSTIYTTYYSFSEKGDKLKVALLQGNFKNEWEWRQLNAFSLILETYLNMTYEASRENPHIIVWPEYALPEDITKNQIVFKQLQETAKRLNTTLVIGSLSYVDRRRDKYKDTAFVFNKYGFSIYEASIPYFFDEDVVKGDASDIIESDGHKIAIIICNEETTNSVARSHSQKDPQFIVSMSNNQELGRGRLVISQFTKIRAAENAKYVLRATNDGITQIVNPLGKVVSSLEEGKRKILIDKIYFNDYKTFYTKYGNILIYLVMIISFMLMLKRGRKWQV
ncbi:hypothetical protein J4448_05745 [Candidatus Woesearchaeota archaeon]|nr:hypothetical protein [Candidatus Woesearchaeota archaeon]